MNKLRILATQYTITTKSLEIYVSGCKHHSCEGCHNPETWEFNQGEVYDTAYFMKHIYSKVKNFPLLVENIMIFGGEPLDSDLGELLFECNVLKKPIWIFTHYELDEVPDYIKNYCTYIKTGAYRKDLTVDNNIQYGIKLATSNQKIHKKGVDY